MNTENDSQSEHQQLRRGIYADWRAQLDAPTASCISATMLLALWSRYKFVVLAHDPRIYRRIGPLLADLSCDVQARAEQVLEMIMTALAQPAPRQNHINALQHVAGFVSKSLDVAEKQAWLTTLADYQTGRAEFPAAAILLQGLLQRHGGDYVQKQQYPRCFLATQQREFAR